MTTFDPEIFLESTIRCLHEYLVMKFHRSVSDGSQYVGENIYEVIPQFPGADLDLRKVPLLRTVIHFEIDNITSRPVGIGDNIYDWTEDPANPGSMAARYAQVHLLNIDIGIWASDASGGVTARSRAKQILQFALGGSEGIIQLRDFSDGGDGALEIMSFTGGRFIMDKVNDMQIFRMADCTLILRVYSRTPLDDALTAQAIEEILIDPDVYVDDNGTLVEIE